MEILNVLDRKIGVITNENERATPKESDILLLLQKALSEKAVPKANEKASDILTHSDIFACLLHESFTLSMIATIERPRGTCLGSNPRKDLPQSFFRAMVSIPLKMLQ
jgi:hypothetical protein